MPPKNTTERKSPRTTGGWVYATKLTKEEEHVRQEGFPWVSISTIKKDKPLGKHSHHSCNTHLVLTGKIAFFPERQDEEGKAPTVWSISPDQPPRRLNTRFNESIPGSDENYSGICTNDGRLFTVAKDNVYRAELSECDECSFVEGHEVLSPTTRDRFISRGNIKWDADAAVDSVGPVDRDVVKEGDLSERALARAKLRG